MRRWRPILGVALLLLFSCHNPVHELDPDICTLRVRTEPADASRTVVPDFSTQFDSLVVSLSSNDDHPSPAPQTDTAAPWQVGFSVQPGSWNIQVLALRSGAPVGSGTKTVTLASGLVDPVIVPLTFDAGAATGDVRFAVRFPASTDIDYVHGLITETSDEFAPTLTASGASRSGTFEFSGLAPSLPGEAYTLVLTFKRGGATGKVAGVFREKIIVVGGFTSGSWVGPGGELLGERAFSEDEFYNPETALSGLSISDGVFPAASFNPAVLDYDRGAVASLPSSVTFTAIGAIDGQYLEYSWNEGTFEGIRSGTPSPSLDTADIHILKVRVTAPDRATKYTYRVIFTDTLASGIPYSYPVPGGAIGFTLDAGETSVTITSYTGSGGNVVLPGEIGGYPVTSVGAVFSSQTGITSVVIPDSVTTIAGGAFWGCSSMTALTLPAGLTAIANGLIDNCFVLASLSIPSTVESIGYHSFNNCWALQTINMYRATPPTLDPEAFYANPASQIIFVPQGALNAYETAPVWKDLNVTYLEGSW